MNKGIFRASLLAGAVAVSATTTAQAYELGGPAYSISSSSTGWAFQGSYLSAYRDALTNPANFGPGGVINESIWLHDLATFDAASLQGIDGLVIPLWQDIDADPGFVQAIKDFFLAGGDLFILQDNSDTDPVGAALGLAATSDTSSFLLSGSGNPISDGPFGSANSGIGLWGDYSTLSPTDVANTNGHVGLLDENGGVRVAFWDDGAYAPGAGRMVISGDIDLISTWKWAEYQPLNANGIAALNATAYLVQGIHPIPVPLPAAAWMALGGVGAVIARNGIKRLRRAD